MDKEKRLELGLLGLFFLGLVFIGVLWNKLPDEIPMHFNFGGGFGNVSSKRGLLLIYLPSYFFFLLVHLYMKSDKDSYKRIFLPFFIFRGVVILVVGFSIAFLIWNALNMD